MDIKTLTAFFKWCTIINGGLLIFSVILFMTAPDFIYTIHSKMLMFQISREVFDAAFYSLVGLYKIIFLMFNAVPYIALLIIRRSNAN